MRLVAIEMVHGSAGSTAFGAQKNLWAPAATGSRLRPVADQPDAARAAAATHLTIVSNTDVRNAEAFELPEIGGDHFRSSAVFLTQATRSRRRAPTSSSAPRSTRSTPSKFGQDTPIPSMQLCIENVDQAGGCSYGYSCVYTDTISWASPTEPLPMIRDPRAVFDQLFGVGATPEARAERRRDDKSILDFVTADGRPAAGRELGAADRARLADYLDDVREIERRIQKVEAQNTSGEPRELPGAPIGVPDSFDEHVKLMFDLQAVAFACDITRVFSFKLGRDGSNRVYPESGSTTALPPGVAPPGARGPDPRLPEDQHLPRQPAAVLPRQAEEHARRRRHPARQHAGHLRLADGQLERAQPQALPAVRRRPRRRPAEGRPARQGRRRHADGQRDADAAAPARPGRRRARFGDSTGALDLNAAPDTTATGLSAREETRRCDCDSAGGVVAAACSARRRAAASAAGGADAAARPVGRRGDGSGDRDAAVRALLQQGGDVNAAQGDGMTALHWAATKATPSWPRCWSTPAPT